MRPRRLDAPHPASRPAPDHPSLGPTSRARREASAAVPHSVVALIGSIDLRAVTAIDAGRLLGGDRLTALHVVEPGEDLDDLARRWMRLRCSNVPLRTVDTAAEPEALVRTVVESVVPDDPNALVTVVMGQLQFARRWHRWLHDRTGDRIATALDSSDQVRVLSVPILVPA